MSEERRAEIAEVLYNRNILTAVFDLSVHELYGIKNNADKIGEQMGILLEKELNSILGVKNLVDSYNK